ncbi:hypothetical protein V1264_018657 [Littorina saxatilis]|uniref:Uncharacterized protein n=2 Tax=Littorina saxatilis TaxID=31220 RepID=A0AAN9BFK6_9CAEN
MSDTEVQASKPAGDGQRTVTENGFCNGQEVNKAKDPADGGGSLPQKPDQDSNSDKNVAQPDEQLQSHRTVRRGISFPPESYVSGYCDPPDPWKGAPRWTPYDIISAYKRSCEKHATKPLNKVIQQVEGFSCNGKREEKLVLKNEKLDIKQCETFEEILRRVQFKNIDLESCHLDDESAVAWFDMIEFYESAVHFNISFNKNISVRGWQACSRLIRRTPCLTSLDLRNCDMNDRSIPIFGRALKLGSHITVLHMENMYLSGRSLIILVAALKMNEILQELFLADNRLMPSDGIQLGNLLKYNHSLALLDLRNNHLQDVGVGHVCDGLYEQNLDKGLRTLVLWNNQITYQSMAALSKALGSTKCLETLNLGHNNVTNEGIHILKEGLLKSKSLMRLGLQSTRLTCEGAVALAEYIADSSHLLRLDLRENDIKTAGLMAVSLALKVNESVTRVDLDKETKKESGMKDYADQQRRLQQEIKGFLERNQQGILEREEEERRQMEERAQVEMTARASVQSIITSAQEAVQAHPEMLYSVTDSPEPGQKRRPSLLLDAQHLTPQESLESPHCADVHIFPVQAGETQTGIPEVSLSSPPQSLDLPNPLTSQAAIASTASTSEASLSLPRPNPRTSSLRSPPPELLLSPQYYPKPTARKIFSVSRVYELSPASPTVSKTGVLDTGATGVSHTPAMRLSAGAGRLAVGGGPSPISPTLLCQDLSTKTVNVFLQQIVSDSTLPAEAQGKLEEQHEMDQVCTADDPMEGFGEGEGQETLTRKNVSQKGDGMVAQEGVEEGGGCGDLDPLGVMQTPTSPAGGEVLSSVGCDSANLTSVDSSLGGGEPVSSGASESRSLGEEVVVGQNECGKNGGKEMPADSSDTVSAEAGIDTQNIPAVEEDCYSDDDLFAASSSVVPQQNPSVPERLEAAANDLEAEVGRMENQSHPSTDDREKVEVAAVLAVTDEPGELENTVTSAADLKSFLADPEPSFTDLQSSGKSNGHPAPAHQVPEESPLFKTMEFTHFDINEEDLSLFGAGCVKPASTPVPSPSPSSLSSHTVGQGGGESKKGAWRENSPGLGDTWLAVDASSLGGQEKGEQKVREGEKQPDFFTSLSMNGLTQELASALNSIDGADCVGESNTEMHTPDEFERELDAMLASVRNELPWPLQQDQSPDRNSDTDKQLGNEDSAESQSTA